MASSPPGAQQTRATYPALLTDEAAVWRGWLAKHESEWDRFDYNVRVGPGFDPGEGVDPAIRKQAIYSSKKRIDALAWRGSQALIVEVKDRAGLSAVGQILGYKVYWTRENPSLPAPQLLLVARTLAAGVGDVLQAHGVPYELVTPQNAIASPPQS